ARREPASTAEVESQAMKLPGRPASAACEVQMASARASPPRLPPSPVGVAEMRLCGVKSMCALRSALIVTEHVLLKPASVQSPPHERMPSRKPGRAVSVTTVPAGYEVAQAAPQLMPAGDDVTVPVAALMKLETTVRLN